jgi:hypothetical protein
VTSDEARVDALERKLGPGTKQEYFDALDRLRRSQRALEQLQREYQMSDREIASSLVSNLVKSYMLRAIAATPGAKPP